MCILRIGNCNTNILVHIFINFWALGAPKWQKTSRYLKFGVPSGTSLTELSLLPAKLGLSKPSNIKNGPKIKIWVPPSKNPIVVCPLSGTRNPYRFWHGDFLSDINTYPFPYIRVRLPTSDFPSLKLCRKWSLSSCHFKHISLNKHFTHTNI